MLDAAGNHMVEEHDDDEDEEEVDDDVDIDGDDYVELLALRSYQICWTLRVTVSLRKIRMMKIIGGDMSDN